MYYFLLKAYRKKKSLNPLVSSKINNNILNTLTYFISFMHHFPRNPPLYFKSYMYYTLNINWRHSY